ncbi:MAG: hypothetical protein DRI89_03135 [Bacteroidetes bacterium]|nr:MAG: hypothetical protein DRI89_03135 [Bacteroidota bacterium]
MPQIYADIYALVKDLIMPDAEDDLVSSRGQTTISLIKIVVRPLFVQQLIGRTTFLFRHINSLTTLFRLF